MEDAIFDKIRTLISEQEHIEKSEITLNSDFGDDLDFDSLSLFQLLPKIEDAFSIEILDKDVEKFRKVQDVVNYLQEHGARVA